MNKDIYNSFNDQSSQNEAEAVWSRCVEVIKDNVNWRTFQTWFEPIKAVSLQSSVLTLQVPSQFFYEWLEEHYVELLGKTIKRILGKEGRLDLPVYGYWHDVHPWSAQFPEDKALLYIYDIRLLHVVFLL